jgi:hypothetical protein
MNSKLSTALTGAAAALVVAGCATSPDDREATARLNWSSCQPHPLRETVANTALTPVSARSSVPPSQVGPAQPAQGPTRQPSQAGTTQPTRAEKGVPQPAQPSGPGTALLVVRFANEINPNFQPTNLALTVEDTVRQSGGQFVFKPFRAIPGQFAEFLVRLDLPAGDYRVTRLFGVAGQGQTAPQFDFPAEQRFKVEVGQTAYLGRVEVTNRPRRAEGDTATGPSFGGDLAAQAGFSAGSPRVTAHDATEEDMVSFRTQWNDLRERRIETRLSESFAVPAPSGSASAGVQARFPQLGVPSGEFVTAQPLDASAADALPAPLRSAFTRFAASKHPRAFAYERGGASGAASGTASGAAAGAAYGVASGGDQVIARALQQCEQRRGPAAATGRPPCILYAVDDSVMADGTHTAPGAVPDAPSAAATGQQGQRAAPAAVQAAPNVLDEVRDALNLPAPAPVKPVAAGAGRASSPRTLR